MQINLSVVEKQAIKAALNENWKLSIELNKKILENTPNDLNAKIRLGRAYLSNKDFTKALKIFKEVLKADPINSIALKNIELAKKKKTKHTSNNQLIIKEPGTSKEVDLEIDLKGITASSFDFGDKLELKALKTKVNIIHKDKVIGAIKDEKLVSRLNLAQDRGISFHASFLKGMNKNIKILICTSEPMFRGEKQDIKPYMKKGSLEEPELEIENFDD